MLLKDEKWIGRDTGVGGRNDVVVEQAVVEIRPRAAHHCRLWCVCAAAHFGCSCSARKKRQCFCKTNQVYKSGV